MDRKMPGKKKKVSSDQFSLVIDLLENLRNSAELQNYLTGEDVEEYEIKANTKLIVKEEVEVKPKRRGRQIRSKTSLEFESLTVTEILEKMKCKCVTQKDWQFQEEEEKEVKQLKQQKDDEKTVYSSSLLQEMEMEEEKMKKEQEEIRESKALAKLRKKEFFKDIKISQYISQYFSIKDFAFTFVENILREAQEKINVDIINPLEDELYLEKMRFYEIKAKELKNEGYADREIDEILDSYAEQFEKDAHPQFNKQDEIAIDSEATLETSVSDNSDNVYFTSLTPKEGIDKIKKIVSNWKMHSSWKYSISFLQEQSDTCYDMYIYEVKWSTPTNMYPIPQVTASVYFYLEKPRVKPHILPIKISYRFEGGKYLFNANEQINPETFIEDIVDEKTMLYRDIRF